MEPSHADFTSQSEEKRVPGNYLQHDLLFFKDKKPLFREVFITFFDATHQKCP